MSRPEGWGGLGGREIGIAGVLLVMALGGCNTIRPVAQLITPPADLMADCPEPSSDAATNEELVNRFLDMRGALRRCNADKEALRTWSAEATKDNPDD